MSHKTRAKQLRRSDRRPFPFSKTQQVESEESDIDVTQIDVTPSISTLSSAPKEPPQIHQKEVPKSSGKKKRGTRADEFARREALAFTDSI